MYGSSRYVQLSTMLKMVWKEDEKYKKLLAIILGSIDSVCGRMGKCRWKILR